MKRTVKIIIALAVILVLGYNSVYFKKLSAMDQGSTDVFDATAFSEKLWSEQLPAKLDTAVMLTDLISAVRQNPEQAFQQHSNALAIGNYRYALVRLEPTIVSSNENEWAASIPLADSSFTFHIEKEFIYGNAVRDASGLVSVKDFPNTDRLNMISASLDSIVRAQVVAPMRDRIKAGDKIKLTGAIQLNTEHLNWNDLDIIPVKIEQVD